MASPPQPKLRVNWTEIGAQRMEAGDYRQALDAFSNAAKADKGVAVHRYNMAIACMALGDAGSAAEHLTEALRLRPSMLEAAQQLSNVVRGRLPSVVRLNTIGLKAALEFDQVYRDQIAEVAVYYLAGRDPLKSALDRGRSDGFLTAARQLCLKSTSDLLKDDLFQKALSENTTASSSLK